MKSKYLKDRMKVAPKRAGCYALNCGGAIAGSAIIGADKVEKIKPQYRAFGLVAIGLLSSLANPEEYSNSLLTGMGAAGSIYAAANLSKKADMFGVTNKAAGLTAGAEEGTKGTEEFDWTAAANRAGTSGTPEQEVDVEDEGEESLSDIEVDEVIDSLT